MSCHLFHAWTHFLSNFNPILHINRVIKVSGFDQNFVFFSVIRDVTLDILRLKDL